MEAGDNVLKAWEIKTKIDQWGSHQTKNMLHEGNNQYNTDGACGRKQYLKAVFLTCDRYPKSMRNSNDSTARSENTPAFKSGK